MNSPTPAAPWMRALAWWIDTSIAVVPAFLIARLALHSKTQEVMEKAQALTHPPAVTGPSNALAVDISGLQPFLLEVAAYYIHYSTVLFIAMIAVYALMSVVQEGGLEQATWGKRWMGIHVERNDGDMPGYLGALVRFMSGGLGWATLNLGHAMASFRSDRKMLHDLVSGTRVIADEMEATRRRNRALGAVLFAIVVPYLASLIFQGDSVAEAVLQIIKGIR